MICWPPSIFQPSAVRNAQPVSMAAASSVGALLLLREAEIGIASRLDAAIRYRRDPTRIDHELPELLKTAYSRSPAAMRTRCNAVLDGLCREVAMCARAALMAEKIRAFDSFQYQAKSHSDPPEGRASS